MTRKQAYQIAASKSKRTGKLIFVVEDEDPYLGRLFDTVTEYALEIWYQNMGVIAVFDNGERVE